MQDNKLVSVIIPLYNNESFVSGCIESFLAQTYTNIEVIVVNDGSTDNSLEVVRQYAQRDGRVRIVDKVNEGVSTARNAGLEVCSGDYICFADSDDYVDSCYIEYLLGLLIEHDAGCVICAKLTERADGKLLCKVDKKEKIVVFEKDQMDFRDSSFCAVVIHKLYKAECLRPNGQWLRFDPELIMAEDSYFSALAVPNINRIVKSSKQLYHYVRHDTNATRRPDYRKCVSELRSWYKILELGKTLGERYEYSAQYELVSRCFRVHRAARPKTKQERRISRQIVGYMRKNASYIFREIGYPVKLKLVFAATLIFPWLTRGMNS